MFKRFAPSAVLAVAAIAALSACGSGSGSAGGADDNPASASGTIRVLVPSYPASNDGKAALQKVIDAFHKTYPNVKVEPDFATFGTLNEKISTSIASGQGYDVYVTGIGWIPPFASKGVFKDLGEFGVTKDSLSKGAAPALPAAEYNGKIYAVPLIFGPKPMAYSKKAFAAAGLDPTKPPQTWAELREAAIKLTKRDGGKITQAGFDFWAPPSSYRQDFVTFLGSLGQPMYKDGKANFATPEGAKALEEMASLINDDKVSDFGLASPDGQPLVFTGKAAMGVAGGYVDCAKVGQARCDDLAFFNLKDQDTARFSGGQLASVGAQSQLPKASYEFVKLLSSPEAASDIAKLNFGVPAVDGVDQLDVVKSNPASAFAATQLDHMVFEGGSTNWLEVRNDFGAQLDTVLLGKADAATVLQRLASK